MTATAESAQEPADAPNTLEIAENPATSLQRTGNGIVVNGQTARRHIGVAFNPSTASAAGKRRPATERKQQAEAFANTCHDLLKDFRRQMGLNQPQTSESATGRPVSQANGQISNGANGQGTCESESIESARSRLKEAAGILVNLTRAWDTALERHRVLSGVPDPGCRRPGEPMPKARKPANRAPDSLACGSDTPTGSVPLKG